MIFLLSLLVAFGLGVTTASAQTTAVCSNTPATGERIKCEEDATSTNNIDSDTSNVTISTAADGEDGIEVTHLGSGDVDIDIQGGLHRDEGGLFLRRLWTSLKGRPRRHDLDPDGRRPRHHHTGADGHGIVAYNHGTLDTASISIDVRGLGSSMGGGSR